MPINRLWVFLALMCSLQQASALDDIAHYPPLSAQADASPRNMIVMSNDHNLFFKAYTDWSDLDDDGVIDATYKPSIEYYGYFSSQGCYQYSSSLEGGAFTRSADADNDRGCSGMWSGNLLNWATMTRMDIIRKVLYGGKRYRDVSGQTTILERAFLPMDSHSFAKVISDPNIIAASTPLSARLGAVTFCNTTYANSRISGSVTAPPLIRVARGSQAGETGWPNWASTEVWQCSWKSGEKYLLLPGNSPVKSAAGSTEYRARVEVCQDGGNDSGCLKYPDSDYAKPTGLLQAYGSSIDFGLLTGSYAKNKSGGVLRSNFAEFSSEYNSSTGVFLKNTSGNDATSNGIVSNLDAMRIAQYNYSTGNYESCPYSSSFDDGKCSNWGNPFAEMALEALRYLSGEENETSDFSNGEATFDSENVSGLSVAPWSNDVDAKWCAAHSMLMINASDISFDNDSLSVNDSPVSASDIRQNTNAIGDGEKISGKYFVGQSSRGDNNKICTAKDVSALGQIQGICPTAPGLEGSYNIAGLARYAHTHSMIESSKGNLGSEIDTYAAQLSSNVPIVKAGSVSIVPACRNSWTGGKCAIVDFRVIAQAPDASSGSFSVVWDDAEFGSDFDLDAAMRLDYVIQDNRLRITTEITRAAAFWGLGLGYILSGTDDDGFHAHSGISNYTGQECVKCNQGDPATSREYAIEGTSGQTLSSPLYYAAKYGNGARNTDGTPGGYFEVNRIGELSNSLQALLDQVIEKNNLTGAGITLGYDGEVSGLVYQTLYNNQNSWSGDVRALSMAADGTMSPKWSAREMLPSYDKRHIITRNPTSGAGLAFTVDKLKEAGLPINSETRSLIQYLRGDSSQEQRRTGGKYRDRLWLNGDDAKLGDFIGSQPYLVSVPNTYHVPDNEDTSYADFRAEHAHRRAMLYVGGNDGMLHAFDAGTGVEKLAYVPGLIQQQLPELADPAYSHRYYVDGSPTVLDARLDDGGSWFSLLSSGLGGGGKGVFALDVTDPEDFGNDNNASNIALWEYGPEDDMKRFKGEKQQLGYIFNKPSIVQMENGRFAVVFGNGYSSEAGKASIYVLYVDGGADAAWEESDVVRLTPPDQDDGGNNGMATISLVDRDNDGRVDLAYGADLQGNIWRFDLKDNLSEDGIHLLFTAKRNSQRQVLTSTLEVGNHPDGGLMIFFGTGAEENYGLPTTQDRKIADSFYAIRDYLGNTLRTDTLSREVLGGRAFHTASVTGSDDSFVQVRYLDPVATDKYPENGWYLDFDGDERVVDGPSLRGNRVLFSSIIPGYGICGAEDAGYLYELNAWYGSAFATPVLDVNGDGSVDEGDRYYSSDGSTISYIPIGVATDGAIFTPEVVTSQDGQQETKISANTKGGLITIAEAPLNNIRLGRVTWRTLE